MKQSLAIKYRPKSFEDMTEQTEITQILNAMLAKGLDSRCFLFVGSAGIGKTTAARILANMINDGKGMPIEIDGATNGSVENARNIVAGAKTRSLESNYKVYIIDECFRGDTLISVPGGAVPIKDIKVGDTVYNLNRVGKVTQVFQNKVFTDRLCRVIINGAETYTTVDHLYLTNIGWVEASKLKRGDIVYGVADMSEMWQRVCGKSGHKVLQCGMQESCVEGACGKEEATSRGSAQLCNLRKTIRDKEVQHEASLQRGMQKDANRNKVQAVLSFGSGDTESTKICGADETKQSCAYAGCYRESSTNEGEQGNSACLVCGQRGQRSLHACADNAVGSFETDSYIRIRNTDRLQSETREGTISYELQSRPRISRDKASDRGGWCIPQMEKWFVARCEENTVVNEFRVESVEVYKRGDNDEYFECAFDDKELSSGVVTMYDLQVEGHPSYFANGVLVHNCHSISNAAWQSLLLVLEQPPQHTCFIFCTTNPEKIPGTILSRVQRFDFRRISLEGIVSRLTHILNAEISEGQPYTYTQEAVEYIAKLAKGGMRSAITSLEKCLNYDADLTLQSVMNALGIVDYTKLFDLADCVLDYNTKGALAIIQQAHDDGKDLKLFMSDFTAFVLDVCKYALTADYSTIKIPNTYSARLLELCKDFKFFKDFLSKLIELNNSIKYERDPKSVIEMNFVVWSSK